MQTFRVLLITVFSFSSFFVTAQPKNESVRVLGNCGMCQGRIEKAAKAAGAATASWDANTTLLTVTYDAGATTISAIEAKVASVGHDTRNKRAPKERYDQLHGCCQYEREQTPTGAASCCKGGGSCCSDGLSCCAKPASHSTASVKECCVEGADCCKTGQHCCPKATVAPATPALDCCANGHACCTSGADCCTKSAVADNAFAKDCCVKNADCCAAGSACCTRHAVPA